MFILILLLTKTIRFIFYFSYNSVYIFWNSLMAHDTSMSMEEFKVEMDLYIEESADDLIIQLRKRWAENKQMSEYV